MPFLPRDFVIPEPPATDEFMLTPLRVDHLVLEYEAVMSSCERLRSDRIAGGLEERLATAYRAWVAAAWPFQCVAWPGRDQPW